MYNTLVIANRSYSLDEIKAKSLKGITLEMRSSFRFFKLETLGQNVILLKSKYPLERYTPKACKRWLIWFRSTMASHAPFGSMPWTTTNG